MIFHRRRQDSRDSLRINLTPLIDTVFLLLMFFMLTTTFNRQSELQINLPEAKSEQIAQTVEPIRIIINSAGQYAINTAAQSLVDTRLETLTEALKTTAGAEKSPRLLISADANAPHQAVMRALEAARDLGYVNIGFEAQQATTAPPASSP